MCASKFGELKIVQENLNENFLVINSSSACSCPLIQVTLLGEALYHFFNTVPTVGQDGASVYNKSV